MRLQLSPLWFFIRQMYSDCTPCLQCFTIVDVMRAARHSAVGCPKRESLPCLKISSFD
jgi:hypothetical protein